MKKIYKLSPITTAILLFVIGLALILLPYSVVGITLRVIGAVLLALEIYRAIPYCRRGADPTALLMFILSEIFVIIFAFIMLLNPIGAVNALCVVFGIYLVISAAIELYRLSKLSFIKIGVYVMPIITLLVGAFLVFYPAGATKLTFIIIGIAIIIKSLDIAIYELTHKRPVSRKTKTTRKKTIVTNDYKDVSGK
jgi:uncharacterized membrane protein HdeD (DUF308 family)